MSYLLVVFLFPLQTQTCCMQRKQLHSFDFYSASIALKQGHFCSDSTLTGKAMTKQTTENGTAKAHQPQGSFFATWMNKLNKLSQTRTFFLSKNDNKTLKWNNEGHLLLDSVLVSSSYWLLLFEFPAVPSAGQQTDLFGLVKDDLLGQQWVADVLFLSGFNDTHIYISTLSNYNCNSTPFLAIEAWGPCSGTIATWVWCALTRWPSDL